MSFPNIKNPKYTFCRELNSEYQLWVLLRWRHCDVIYKHLIWRRCRWSHPVMNSVLLFVFCGQKGLKQMRFTVRCVQCMATSVLWDQQYRYGVRSLLAAEKTLVRNDLIGMLLRQTMPQLPQFMLSYGLTSACQFQTLFSIPVFHEFQCTESSAIISSFWRCLLDGCQNS